MKRRLLPTIVLMAALLASPGAMIRVSPAQAAKVLAAPLADTPTRTRYTITDLGTLGDHTYAYGLNEVGQVVGTSTVGLGVNHAFLWEDDTMQDLGTLGGLSSTANGLNEAGQIVGSAQNSSGTYHPFMWQNGSMQDLGTLGGTLSSFGREINNSGQIVGSSPLPFDGTAEVTHAFLWQDGSMQDLGTLGGFYSGANDINDFGQLVGSSQRLDGKHNAFLWENSSMQDLGSLENYGSLAIAINEIGHVVGRSTLANGYSHAFLWQNGSMQDLGTLGGNQSWARDINDQGQVVGMSYSSTATYQRAFLWENSQMNDLNDLIPEDSGWILHEAYGINNKGQIVGNGLNNGLYRAFLLTPNTLPVLIVPGIAGTYSGNTFFDYGWLTHRGVHPNDLQIDPLGRFYHDLIQTFKNLGYVEGKDLFVVNYDWRLSPGPIDGQFDGIISGLNAQALSDDQFNYAVDYLGWYLRKASEAYRDQYGSELPAVNLISHSTGGLVARTYIQSGTNVYGGVYDAANDYHLPKIDQFIMVGVPNRGASKAWNPIHNNWTADPAYRALLSKIINRAYQKVTAILGATIQGPDYNINEASILVEGTPDEVLFIEKYVPTIRSLLATYDFINFGEGYVNVNNDPALRNNLVLDLNNGLDLLPTTDSNPFADHTTTTVICGASGSTAYLVFEHTSTPAEDVLLPFTDFFANDAGVDDVWYEDLWLMNGGDQTVPLESCQEQFIGDTRIEMRLFSGEKTDHTGLMANISVQGYILDKLQVEFEPQDISSDIGVNYLNAISVISDPAETILVDGAGRRLGYSLATGVLTEIPGSVWFGDSEGFGFVSGNFLEPLHLELTGLGEEHYVMVSVERFGKPAGGAISSGYLALGQTLIIPIDLNSKYIFIPMINR